MGQGLSPTADTRSMGNMKTAATPMNIATAIGNQRLVWWGVAFSLFIVPSP
jgi:hypothetical protein